MASSDPASSQSEDARSSSPSLDANHDWSNASLNETHYRSLKRRCEELTAALGKPKKKTSTTYTLGRGIRRVVTLFDDLDDLSTEAVRRMASENLEDTSYMATRRADRLQVAYELLLELIRPLRKIMREEPLRYDAYLVELQCGANSARSDDLSRIKVFVANEINATHRPEELLIHEERTNRGLNHDVCGKLLCPINIHWDNPDIRADIRAGKLAINKNYFLGCLFAVPDEVNMARVEQHYLRSALLVKVYCCIFKSPASVNEIVERDGVAHQIGDKRASKKLKRNVGDILRMQGKVTGRSIAYAAVMLVMNLTEMAQWGIFFNNFSFQEFYEFLVDFFEDDNRSIASKNRRTRLLEWWNTMIYPEHVEVSHDKDESWVVLTEQDDY